MYYYGLYEYFFLGKELPGGRIMDEFDIFIIFAAHTFLTGSIVEA